ncbi:hypothetical protein BS78_08G071300 [Paspalum vaginatum]|nr:hypothetical protein BS78_08G071300 [Paspalum vaginatum]
MEVFSVEMNRDGCVLDHGKGKKGEAIMIVQQHWPLLCFQPAHLRVFICARKSAEDEVPSALPVRCAMLCSGLDIAPALRPTTIPLDISKSCSIALQQSKYINSCSSGSIGVLLSEPNILEDHKVLKLCLSFCLMFNCNLDNMLLQQP